MATTVISTASLGWFQLRRSHCLILMGLGGLLGLLLFFHMMHWHLGVNTSPSIQQGVYRLIPIGGKLKRQDLVTLTLPSHAYDQRHYFSPHGLLIKHIGAVPGETLFTNQSHQYSCQNHHFDKSCRFLGSCLHFDSQGRVMHCQFWSGQTIPAGYYYVLSNRVFNSFDSRYVGLVPHSQIKNRAQLWLPFPETRSAREMST